MHRFMGVLWPVAWVAAVLGIAAGPLCAGEDPTAGTDLPGNIPPVFNRAAPLPSILKGVGITEKTGHQVPLDATFLDENGHKVTLGQYFHGDKPVILDLGYYSCPMLCGLVLHGMTTALKKMSFVPGQQFEIVSLSFNPNEGPALAKAKKRNVIAELGKPQAAQGWHFLTGQEDQIQRVTQAVGFHYRWLPKEQEFAHTTALILISPQGRITRYLYGVNFPPETLRLSLVEASHNKIGSPLDQIILYCCQFNPKEGTYAMTAFNIMRLGGVLAVIVLGGAIGIALWRELRGRRGQGHNAAATTDAHTPPLAPSP